MTQTIQRITRQQDIKRSIIWLHGLGADSNDFIPIVDLLQLDASTAIIFPDAPIRPITLNNGYRMRGWYDIVDLHLRDSDKAGILQSVAYLDGIIEKEIEAGISLQNILLAGFSQGGALALYMALRRRCAGVIALSCYLLDEKNTPSATDKLPILMMHGRQDPVVAYSFGCNARDVLGKLGYDVQWQDYAMAHEVTPQQITAIAQFLHQLGF